MYKKLFVFVAVLFLVGCTKLKHVPQLFTLKGLLKEQTELDTYVQWREKKFEDMVVGYKQNGLVQYKDKISIVQVFGNPIVVKQVGEQEEWLYRQANEFFKTDRILMYFDQDGFLVDVKYVEYIEEDAESLI